MDSIKRRLLPLLAALVLLLCSCTAGTPDNSPSTSPSLPAPSQVQPSASLSPPPSETDPSEVQPYISPSPAVTTPEPSPSAAPVSEAPAAAAVEDPVEVIVYVTKTGEKYHAAGCQYLSRSQIPMSLEDAKASGYTPCSKCHPPR
ncbi:hypothetical protein [uncultured Pseudoflavonifractor sp.]|uniref:hypothetical protein n=1 Tax=uncultured Pseudoflavonifractor sp. TaxID=1221379 RepID=UPI0025D8F144|nr:hypothetical protein [uncultured Pseudoflavonifractor sp.]